MLCIGNFAIEMQKVSYVKYENGVLYFYMKDNSVLEVPGTEKDFDMVVHQLFYFDKDKKEHYVGYHYKNYAIYLSEVDYFRKLDNSILISFDNNLNDLVLKVDNAEETFNDLVLFYNKWLNTGLERA